MFHAGSVKELVLASQTVNYVLKKIVKTDTPSPASSTTLKHRAMRLYGVHEPETDRKENEGYGHTMQTFNAKVWQDDKQRSLQCIFGK